MNVFNPVAPSTVTAGGRVGGGSGASDHDRLRNGHRQAVPISSVPCRITTIGR